MTHAFRITFCTLVFTLLALTGATTTALAQRGTIDLGPIVAEADSAALRVFVKANDPRLENLMRRAFTLHGGYTLVEPSRAQFEFVFTKESEAKVGLAIRSGGQTQLERSVTGADWADAALTLGDFAVARTLQLPGIFNGQLAFVSDRSGNAEIYLADLLFTRSRQLTSDRSQCLLPALSPTGGKLLYTSYHRNGFPDIYSIDLRSNRREVFASFRGTNTGASFSPDGQLVSMVLSSSGNPEIYVSNASGGQMRRVTRTEGLEADPSWAPDGQRLVFTSDNLGKPQIYTIRLDGRDMKRVPTNISRNCSEPDWNPRDANVIAFTAAMGNEFEVAIFDFAKGESRVITRGPGDAVHPHWLRDGRHLIYTERTSKYRRLMLLDTQTGKAMRLSPDDFGNSSQASYVYK